MLTRACPLRNVHDCASCRSGGTLRDRKGRDFTVTCSAPGGAGIRTVYNPVPLYMGDRLREMPVDTAVAAFTTETPQRTAQILAELFAAQPFDNEFTRGDVYKRQSLTRLFSVLSLTGSKFLMLTRNPEHGKSPSSITLSVHLTSHGQSKMPVTRVKKSKERHSR